MATMTMEPMTIKTAMNKIGLEDRTDELLNTLDEIELDRLLEQSEEQDEKGMNISAEELKKQIEEEFRNGIYG
jgi:hypothetical protein